MALSDEEKATLEALTKKASEPEQEDFAIEIWDETGAGAKVPFSQGAEWLKRFGIGVEKPADSKPEGNGKTPKADDGKTPVAPAQRYFGKSKS